jgi:hypothetical protein
MIKILKPKEPDEMPQPAKEPEIISNPTPETPALPDEKPTAIPEEEPSQKPVIEIPEIPKED